MDSRATVPPLTMGADCAGYQFEPAWASDKYLKRTELNMLNRKWWIDYDSKRWRLRLLFEYLRFSPSYWQVHLRQTGQAGSKTVVPKRQIVEKTYKLMGDG